jgi:hypothetical protein
VRNEKSALAFVVLPLGDTFSLAFDVKSLMAEAGVAGVSLEAQNSFEETEVLKGG